MPKPINHSEYKRAKLDRNFNSGMLRYFGGGNNQTRIASRHYREFGNRFDSENAAALREAEEESHRLREKGRVNRAKHHTGKMNWPALKEGKCPVCDMTLQDDGNLMRCDLHAGPPFLIGYEKYKNRLEE